MDSRTAEKLKTVHPVLAQRITQLIAVLASLSFDFRVTDGNRTFAEQNELYAKGRTKPGKRVTNAVGGQSNHNYGLACDLAPFTNGKLDYENRSAFQALGRESKKLGLEWGGDWQMVDMPHVQLKGLSVKECQKYFKQGGMPAVWQRMDEILKGGKREIFIPKTGEMLEFGDRGAEVEKLQKDLASLGYLRPHEIDGEFGKITKNAVIGFQRQNKLTADGIVGPGTRTKIAAAIGQKSSLFTPATVQTAPAPVQTQSAPSIQSSPAPVQPTNETSATETTTIEKSETTAQIVEQKNEQSVNETAEVKEPAPQGFLKKLGAGMASVLGGTLIYDAAGKMSGIQFSMQTIYIVCFVLLLGFLGFCLWAVLDAWKQNNRIKFEVESKTAIDRKNLKWVKE